MSIEAAIEFVVDEVEAPALEHPLLEKAFKNKVTRSKVIVHRIKKVGDLKRYLQRFEFPAKPGANALYDRFKELGLKTYEDLYPEFCLKFASELDDVTVLDDFVIGRHYTSWDISVFAQTYDTQAGIYLIGDRPNYQAIFIKATLENGKYPNKWVIPNEKLQYYFYSREGVFSESYAYNAAIIDSKHTSIPIYVFINRDSVLHLNGIFEFDSVHADADNGSKWFVLNKKNSLYIKRAITPKEYNEATAKEVHKARETDKALRRERLKHADKIPGSVQVVTTAYKRNPDVIVEVLLRSIGCCELCGKPAPFIRASDLTPYLEVHHKIPLADGGEDTVENAIAVCPNCHRAEHFAADVKRVTAGILIEEGKVFIAKRGGTGETAGKWELPGGKVEPGETPEQCLRRELLEELQIGVKVGKYVGESVYPYSQGIIRLMAYRVKKIKGEIQPTVHDEVRWVSRNELDQFDFLPADIPLIAILRERMKP
ncbi:NUDIX domain-containing protein [Paenibacillus lautus]|uniref:NUDIX domain-containing protein n=1 Tax=Paenibacillus lautus TaxID=1401 RepID=UPI001C7CCDEC|nr:NUDIX domain-containing protein [Paenibacillus lautus]MBX4150736.1 NUDIX domain-containing protein [Paenibacillus lautus]